MVDVLLFVLCASIKSRAKVCNVKNRHRPANQPSQANVIALRQVMPGPDIHPQLKCLYFAGYMLMEHIYILLYIGDNPSRIVSITINTIVFR